MNIKHSILCTVLLIATISCNTNSNKNLNENQNNLVTPALGTFETKEGESTIEITDIRDETFSFNLSVVNADATCTGEIAGNASYASENGWTFSDEYGCELVLTILANEISISETGSCDHGASCSFSGKYILKEDVEPKQSMSLNDVLDYFMAIPDEYFLCEIEQSFSTAQREQAITYKNIPNGYLKAQFEELSDLQVALFKNKINGKNYLAFVNECGPGCMCNKRHFLVYEDGKWTDQFHTVFPDLSTLGDVDQLAIRLPEKGTTIDVYHIDDPDKSVAKLIWNDGVFKLVE